MFKDFCKFFYIFIRIMQIFLKICINLKLVICPKMFLTSMVLLIHDRFRSLIYLRGCLRGKINAYK